MERKFIFGAAMLGLALSLAACRLSPNWNSNDGNQGQPGSNEPSAVTQPAANGSPSGGQATIPPAALDQPAGGADQSLNDLQATLQAIGSDTNDLQGTLQSLETASSPSGNDLDQSLNELLQGVQSEPTP